MRGKNLGMSGLALRALLRGSALTATGAARAAIAAGLVSRVIGIEQTEEEPTPPGNYSERQEPDDEVLKQHAGSQSQDDAE